MKTRQQDLEGAFQRAVPRGTWHRPSFPARRGARLRPAMGESAKRVRSATICEIQKWQGLKLAVARFGGVPDITRLALVSAALAADVRSCAAWWAEAPPWARGAVPPGHSVQDALCACPGLAHLRALRLQTSDLSRFKATKWRAVCAAAAGGLVELIIDECVGGGPHGAGGLGEVARRRLGALFLGAARLRRYAGPMAPEVALRCPVSLEHLELRSAVSSAARLEAALLRLPRLHTLTVAVNRVWDWDVLEIAHPTLTRLHVKHPEGVLHPASAFRLRAPALRHLELTRTPCRAEDLPPSLRVLRTKRATTYVQVPPRMDWEARLPLLIEMKLSCVTVEDDVDNICIEHLSALRVLEIRNASSGVERLTLRALPDLRELKTRMQLRLVLAEGLDAAPLELLHAPYVRGVTGEIPALWVDTLRDLDVGSDVGASLVRRLTTQDASLSLESTVLYNYLPDALRRCKHDKLFLEGAGTASRQWIEVPRARHLHISCFSNAQTGVALQCKNTASLRVSYLMMLQNIIVPPGGMCRLTDLCLEHCPTLNFASLNQMLEQCPALQQLRAVNLSRMACSGGLPGVHLKLRHPRLRRLRVEWVECAPGVHLRQVHLADCPRLEELTLQIAKRTMRWQAWTAIRLPLSLRTVEWRYHTRCTETRQLCNQLVNVRTLTWGGPSFGRHSLELKQVVTLSVALQPHVCVLDVSRCPRLRSLRFLRHARATRYHIRVIRLPPSLLPARVELPPCCACLRDFVDAIRRGSAAHV